MICGKVCPCCENIIKSSRYFIFSGVLKCPKCENKLRLKMSKKMILLFFSTLTFFSVVHTKFFDQSDYIAHAIFLLFIFIYGNFFSFRFGKFEHRPTS